jgi:hypothetical protein
MNDKNLQRLPTDRGARFLRVALHVNPFAYLGKTGKATPFADEADYNAAVLRALEDAGVEAIGLTDHWQINTSRGLRAAAEAAGIIVFPGFEASTADGVHLLVLFDPGTAEDTIQGAIGACGVVGAPTPASLGKLDVPGLTRIAREEWRAICVAAHATTTGYGILTMKGLPRVRAWKAPNLLAAAIPGAVGDLVGSDRQIVENNVPEYERQRPIAVVNARDVDGPEDVADPSSTTLIKMSEVSVEALRQAFLDPASRIRLNSDPVPARHTQFTRIAWEGGFLRDVVIDLNANLNALIGGRGTGKSCIIESIRYVLDKVPIGPEAKLLHEAIVRSVLGASTKVTLHVRVVRGQSARDYVIERTVPNPAVVKDAAGKVLQVKPGDLVRDIEIYGQHEISELTKSPALLTQLLARFTAVDEQARDRRTDTDRALRENRTDVMRLRGELARTDEQLERLPALEERLRAYEEAGLEDQFKERSALVPEEPIVLGLAQRLTKARAAVAGMRSGIASALRRPARSDAAAVLPHAELIEQAERLITALSERVESIARALDAATDDTERELEPLVTKWKTDQAAVEERYAGILRSVQTKTVDAQVFIGLRTQIEELRQLADERPSQRAALAEALERRREHLAGIEDLRAAAVRALGQAAARVSADLAGVVRVQVIAGAQRDGLEQHLRNTLGGALKLIVDQLQALPDLSVRQLAGIIAEGPDALRATYQLSVAQADHLAKLPEAARLELEELDLAPVTRIELNVRPGTSSPQWQPLSDLSTGQKATAILLLLLLDADTPLVIDQPEDDLDNYFISTDIVPRIKAEKRRRQFVFSSHNANIPVLGDAELIIALEANADRAVVPTDHLGSIDRQSIRDLASDVLEGGRDAFALRRQKYDF